MPKPPPDFKAVLQTLEENAHKAYLVGGCVRDLFMGRTPQDFDIASNAAPEEVIRIFPKTIATGLKHGTVTVLLDNAQIEVTTFRKDGPYLDHRRPQQVTYVDDLTEDLLRRDFTMNAIAMDQRGEITDPTGGRADIQAQTIRAVGDPAVRFTEDALRMFRALRFSAQLGFTIETETKTAIQTQSHLAQTLSPERIRDEIEKILCATRPEIIADVLNYGLLNTYLYRPVGATVPVARALSTLPRVLAATPRALTVSSPAIRATPRALSVPSRVITAGAHCAPLRGWCMFTAILLKDNAITDPEAFLKSLRLSRQITEPAAKAASLAQTPLPDDPIALKRLMAKCGKEVITLTAEAAACLGAPDQSASIQEILQSGECYSLDTLALQGADLLAYGIPQGVQIGETLQKLLDYAIIHPEANTKERLLHWLTNNSNS